MLARRKPLASVVVTRRAFQTNSNKLDSDAGQRYVSRSKYPSALEIRIE